MKRYWAAHLSLLVIAFAMSSPKVIAQAVPATDLRLADSAAVPPSTRPIYNGPFSAYARPTEKQKLRFLAIDAFGPYALTKAALGGAFEQASHSPPEWGTGWNSFGLRLASSFGVQLATTTSRYGMAEILREDTAYYPCRCRGFLPRFGHALISTVTARHGSDGHTTVSISGLASPYAGSMTSLAWYPDRYNVKDGFRMGNYNLGGQALGNLALEFLYGGPHALFGRHSGTASPSGPALAQNP